MALGGGDDRLPALWQEEASRLLREVGWGAERTHVRRFPGGASLVLTAPVDALYAATDLVDAAWAAALARAGGAAPEPEAAARLRDAIDHERNPAILALEQAAGSHGVTFLLDDDGVSLGTGSGARLWALDTIPDADALDWSAIHDVPLILVTGSNGKTTSVRLIAAMAEAAGFVTGHATTEGITIGGALIEADDYSGPMGARRVLRDPAVGFAVLETARGGILRRGLAARHADAALVTNIAEDHFGDWGITTLDQLAEVKLVTARVLRSPGNLCLNVDDPVLRAHGAGRSDSPAWFSLGSSARELARGTHAAWLDGTTLMLRQGDRREAILDVNDVPITMGGAARYNIANALGAVVACQGGQDGQGGQGGRGGQVNHHRHPGESRGPGDRAYPIPLEAMRRGLREFGAGDRVNSGRGTLFEVGGVKVLVDYAHNPHGLAAVAQLVHAVPARRRLLVLGQAGDRTDDAIRELARAAWALRPDRVILKEMAGHRRGRAEGEVPRLLADELQRAGARADQLERVGTEVEAAERALAWAGPGDLLILLLHEERDAVMEALNAARRPGAPTYASTRGEATDPVRRAP